MLNAQIFKVRAWPCSWDPDVGKGFIQETCEATEKAHRDFNGQQSLPKGSNKELLSLSIPFAPCLFTCCKAHPKAADVSACACTHTCPQRRRCHWAPANAGWNKPLREQLPSRFPSLNHCAGSMLWLCATWANTNCSPCTSFYRQCAAFLFHLRSSLVAHLTMDMQWKEAVAEIGLSDLLQ